MTDVGKDTWFPQQVNTVFIVKNITTGTPQEKTVRIFQAPIPPGKIRNLMSLPSVSEADIRHALLKGEISVKLRNREIIVVDSNIDLLQFDQTQLQFLQSVGVVNGLQVGATGIGPVGPQGPPGPQGVPGATGPAGGGGGGPDSFSRDFLLLGS